MKRLLYIFIWIFSGIFSLATCAVIVAWFIDSRQSDQELIDEFSNAYVKPVIHYYQMPEPGDLARTIRFMETPRRSDDTLTPVVLFVHGAPSSLSFFKEFFKDTTLLNQAQLVAVDRPGYGYSDFGRVETSIIRQAELLQPLIERYRNAPFLMIVGSSYGGSISARLAMNNPDRVDHVLFVSSALGPGLEYTYPISYFVDSPLINWGVPPLLRLANNEKLSHREALEAILPDWNKIHSNITMLHGQQDDLVYPSNVSFAQQKLVNAQVKQFLLPENRHDIVFNKRRYMTQIIVDILTQRNEKIPVDSKIIAVNERIKP